jgi:hypothetical protein
VITSLNDERITSLSRTVTTSAGSCCRNPEMRDTRVRFVCVRSLIPVSNREDSELFICEMSKEK